MIRRCPDRPRVDARAGFTFIELLIALIIGGLVVSSIFQVLQGNGRFVQSQSAREEVQQNARAALDLIAADLRAVAPSGILTMDAARIRFYQPRAWGILCQTIRPSSANAWVLFPADVVPADSFFARPDWGLAVEQTANPEARTGNYLYLTGTSRATTADPCNAVQPTGSSQHIRLGFRSPGNPFVTGDSIAPGTQVMLFQEMRYDVAASSIADIPGSWIRRLVGYSGSSANMQPLAGPVPASGGLRFTYLRADGSTAATPAQVRRIGIEVVTHSRASSSQGGVLQPEQVDSASTTVYLRNLPG